MIWDGSELVILHNGSVVKALGYSSSKGNLFCSWFWATKKNSVVTFLGEMLQDRRTFISMGWISSSYRAGTGSSMNYLFMAIASSFCQFVRVLYPELFAYY